ISAPTGPVNLGSVVTSAKAQTVSALLGNVAVTDNRGGTAGWTATVSATNFTGPQTISTTVSGLVVYTAPQAAVTGSAIVAPSSQSTLNPGGPVQNATNVYGDNTATWDPTIAVTIPANALAGTDSTSITHSVS
ncbi:MAG TPA: WxL domain-containing protein, partial [Streptosporangiaceae bacterium]|nr:WxL domain-containing protein [Streptosporangiaceae bacterium]